MAYMNLKKAQAIAASIGDDLKIRLAGSASMDSVRVAADSAGWPMLILSLAGSEVEGAAVIAIRIKAKDAVSKDVLGGDLYAFAPHVAEIAAELDSSGKMIPLAGDLMKVQAKVAQCGVKIALKQIANGTAVTAAAMDAAAVAASFDDLYFPSSGV